MPVTKEILEQTLNAAFPNGKVEVTALANDNEHWSVAITDSSFAGKPRIAQHKIVQAAVNSLDIHALQIKTSA